MNHCQSSVVIRILSNNHLTVQSMLKGFLPFCFIYGTLSTLVDHEILENQLILAPSASKLNGLNPSESQQKPSQRFKRFNGKVDERYRWPNKTVPYWINMTFYTNEHADQIDKAIQILENVTCVRFVNHSEEVDFVTFTGDTNRCTSKVGRIGGEQFIKLITDKVGDGCFRIPSILHEMMHVLGFHHIHRGIDRDMHIKIIWENVLPERRHKLLTRGDIGDLTDFDVGYDVDSLLHYSKNAYSKNGKNTIETIDESSLLRIGQRVALSDGDIKRINRMYKCDNDDDV